MSFQSNAFQTDTFQQAGGSSSGSTINLGVAAAAASTSSLQIQLFLTLPVLAARSAATSLQAVLGSITRTLGAAVAKAQALNLSVQSGDLVGWIQAVTLTINTLIEDAPTSFPTVLELEKLNDHIVHFGPVTNGLDASVLTAATVTASLFNRTGGVIDEINNLQFTHIANGVYRAVVQDTFDPPKGGGYTLKIDVNQSGLKGHFEVKCKVKIRAS